MIRARVKLGLVSMVGLGRAWDESASGCESVEPGRSSDLVMAQPTQSCHLSLPARCTIIRSEIGWEQPLMMDANQRWDVDEAIHNMTQLAQFK